MPQVYVGIGSNIDPYYHITLALDALQQQFAPLAVSKVYQGKAVGFAGDDFLNAVVGFHSDQPVAELAQQLHRIEDQSGRLRDVERFSARTIDLDLLTYGDAVGEMAGMHLPRSDIEQYAFVLRPLVDIAARQLHPIKQCTYQQLWNAFDQPKQQLWPVSFIWHNRDISAD